MGVNSTTSLRVTDKVLTLLSVVVLGTENSTSPRCTVKLPDNTTSRETQAMSSRPVAPNADRSKTCENVPSVLPVP
ncbi:hypothetical protein AQB9606_00003 [Aquabacterium sp. CECT 9606]|nr:hypothetical protein AQB9606_00003 [Aquabacterium sp. CECT 9606]